jgi:23S rRNA pseudouridine2605 synthase
MRKVSREERSGKRPARGDRSTKPGFRPKGNNTEPRKPRRRIAEGDEEPAGRPRRTSERGTTGFSSAGRTSKERDSRFSRSERPAGRPGREEREGRTRKPFGRTSSDSDSGRSGKEYRSTRSDRGGFRTEQNDRPARPRKSFDRESDGPPEERPARTSRFSGSDRPSRKSAYDPADRGPRSRSERPSRKSTYDPADRGPRSRSERPSRKSTYDPADRGPRSRGDRPERTGRSEGEQDSRRGAGFRKSGPAFRKSGPAGKSVLSDDGTTRLNKYISNCGICSRREADELIKAGLVSVNGKIITEMGFKVQPGDEVRYNNELLRGERPVYLLLNKPKDYITTVDDPGSRRTVMELVASACKERIYPVGRLDRNTTGVLLFTNDGDLARKLMHPSFEVQKVYHVTLDKALKPDDMDKILEGIRLEDGPVRVDDIAYAGDGSDRKEIGVEIHSGKNRIVRRIFEHLGHEVVKLDRTVFAGLTKKDLPRGRWRFLKEMEVAALKMQVGGKKLREETAR